MLAVKHAVGGGSASVGLRVAPAVQKVPLEGLGQIAWRAVVNDPKLIEVAGAHHDLVQPFMIGNGVGVQPILVIRRGLVVDIQLTRVVLRVPVVGQRRVKILDEVMDGLPLPHHVSTRGALRFNLHNGHAPHHLCRFLGITAFGNPTACRVSFPNECEDVAVGQHRDVVVLALCGGRDEVAPSEVAFPIEPFNDASGSTGAEVGVVGASGTNQVSVVQQIRHHARLVFTRPAVDLFSAVVDEVRVCGRRDRQQRVSVVRLLTLEHHAHGRGLAMCDHAQEQDGSECDDLDQTVFHSDRV